MNRKEEIRNFVREKRLTFDTSYVQNTSEKIFNLHKKFLQDIFKNKIIGGYYAVNNEVDLFSFIEIIRHIAYPKIDKNNMYFVQCDENKLMVKNRYGFLEPIEESEIIPHILLVPALAVSLEGDRIGYGKGYYDRYLDKYSSYNIFTIAIVFDWQIFPYIESELHDKKIDIILSEKRIINLSSK